MLDKQFFGDEKFHPYLNDKFVVLHVIRGDSYGQQIFDYFGVSATPTVLVANAEGVEIERMIGFTPPAEEFRDKLEKSYTTKPTTLDLLTELENRPDDVDLAVRLGKRLLQKYRRADAGKIAKYITAHPDRARNIQVSDEEMGLSANGYEFGSFLSTFIDPESVKKFVKDFPESELKQQACRNLSRFLYNESKKKDAEKVFKSLIDKDPDDVNLVLPYISFLANNKKDVRKGKRLAENLYEKSENRSNYDLSLTYVKFLLQSNADSRAIDVGNSFMRNNPDEQYFKQDLASELLDHEKYAEAFRVYERGIKENSDNDYFLYAVGRAAAISGHNLIRGEECLKKYLTLGDDLSPGPDAVSWRLGMIYEHMNDINKAIAAYEKALEINPDYSEAEVALNRLKDSR